MKRILQMSMFISIMAAVLPGQVKLEIDWVHSGAVKTPIKPRLAIVAETESEIEVQDTINGKKWTVKIPQIKPHVAVRITPLNGQFHYDFNVSNDATAPDAIRSLRLNDGDSSQAVAPPGWENFYSAFWGKLDPGTSAVFGITINVSPADMILVLSGVDHNYHYEDLIQQGAHPGVLRFISNNTSSKRYLAYRVSDLPLF